VNRIRPKELYVDPGRVQADKCLADGLVADVTFELDDKAVVAQSLPGWPRLDSRQVDRAAREHTEDLIEASGSIAALEAGDRAPVATRRVGHTVPRNKEKAGRITLVVLNRMGENLEAVDHRGERRRNRCGTCPVEGGVAK
jgi:hypothetical protein